MRGLKLGLIAAVASALAVAPVALASPGSAADNKADIAKRAKQVRKADRDNTDNLRHPLAVKQDALRQKALEKVLAGDAKGKVVKVAKGQYVQLARENTDRIFVVIAEFGDTRHASYPDTNPDGSPASDALTYDGPERNEIPQPNRAKDNSTLWKSDYTQAHYKNMYFNRMAEYYERQSSGRYSVAGDVTAWVKVPFNEARYGRNVCGDIVCNNTWFLIRDAVAYWVQGQLDSGKTMEEVQEYLATFDNQDRYDADGDGDFNEPDGFIDHFQIVHAGGDEAAGDPQQGTDAIWSHRWYAAVTGGGPNDFPGVNMGQGGTSSGVAIPDNPTGVWVGDYTIQPENGGLGVFAHEFAHDLGLPDLYDTSGNTGGAENSTGFWTLMSSGANIGDGRRSGIGDDPVDLGAWEKFQLGWLGCPSCPGGSYYDVTYPGDARSDHRVGRNDVATRNAQALFAVLPDKETTLELGEPFEGENYYYSNSGDDLDNLMYKEVSLAADTPLTAKVRYQIEEGWDYAYLVMSADGGDTWDSIATSQSTDEDPNGQNFGNGITGSTDGAWVDLEATLPAGDYLLGFRYWTDGAAVEPGFQADAISIGGGPVDGAEADAGWTFAPASDDGGFRVTTGSEEQSHFNAYVVENRQYDGSDTSLKTAYNFGFANTKPDWVENYRYQNGLLISYWDSSYTDNNVGDHPGSGLILPVDAHPKALHWKDGSLMRQRIQSFDSTFGLQRTDRITVHNNSRATTIGSKAAVPLFDDMKNWWFASDGHNAAFHGHYQVGWSGVDVPKAGTRIRVLKSFDGGRVLTVRVRPAPGS